jgi:CubicO group peptidase (beta-lactamase class C family)
MKIYLRISLVSIVLIVSLLSSCSDDEIEYPDFIKKGTYNGAYFPTTDWHYCSPEEVGVNSALLVKAVDNITETKYATQGYLIIKDGYIIAEDYLLGFLPGEKHSSYSIAKSFTSAVIGIAIDQDYINSVHDKISQYYTILNHDTVQQWKKDISIENLLTMTSGIEWSEENYAGNDLIQMVLSPDYVDYVLNKPVEFEPGTRWSYNSGESMLLSGIINITTEKSMLDFAIENLLNPIGINDLKWISDSENHTVAGWGISATMHDYARFGYLYLNNGNWDGSQIISESWINQSITQYSSTIPYYGYLWWLSGNNANMPEDIYMAIGAFGQYIIIIPSYDLIIVRVGNDLNWNPDEFVQLVLDAIGL